MQSIELTQAHDGTWLVKGETLADRVDDWSMLMKAYKNINKGAGKDDNKK